MAHSDTTVLLTGASGFVALHILEVLLSQGYRVLAAVRSAAKEKVLLQVARSHSKSSIAFVYVTDGAAEGAYDEVFKTHPEIEAVIHTASPFHFNVEDPVKDMLDPAVIGTTNVLNAIKTYGPQVKKVVVTSSMVSVVDRDAAHPPGTVLTEDTWVQISWEDAKKGGALTYRGSKVFAEKALWDFIKNEKPNFQATSILPPYIFGPIIGDVKSPDALNTSSAVMYKVLTGKIPQTYFAEFVDVRDVARAHVRAIQIEESAGKRWLLANRSFIGREAVEAVHNAGLKQFVAPDVTVDVAGMLASKYSIDNSATRRDLGFELTPLEVTAVDTAKDFIQKGLI
jgi:nucleoside-diphosphate-sugar epimerase